MLKLPKRVAHEFAIAAVLLLSSCDQQPKFQFNAAQTDEISGIAREATAQDRLRLDAIEEKLKLANGGQG